jgi:hypothetical protein
VTIEYTIASIATEYAGRLYRSRLEARWAAFFDLCGWHADYEPYDLGLWSPDFLIRGQQNEILVEVTPVTKIDVPTIWKMHTAAKESGFKGDLLLLGAGVTNRCVGWLCSDESPDVSVRSSERAGFSPEIRTMPWFVQAESFSRERPDIGIMCYYKHTRGGVPSEIGVMHGVKGHHDRWYLEQKYSLKDRWNAAGDKVQWHRGGWPRRR